MLFISENRFFILYQFVIVKAGGMRVAQHKPPKEGASAAPASEPEAEEDTTEQQVVEPPKASSTLFISGAEAKVSQYSTCN